MLEKKSINLRIGAKLKKVLAEDLSSSELDDPLPGILWGQWDTETNEHYVIGMYERDELPVDDPVRIIEADGIEFLITQDWICDDLEGKCLDIVNGQLSVIGQSSD